jgi:homoserine O-acetyltransferase
MSAPALRQSQLDSVVTPEIEIIGPPDAPVVVVLGGISSSRHVAASAQNPAPGWWDSFVGDGKTIDTTRYRVLSMDYEAAGRKGRLLTTNDQALVLASGLDAAGITRVRAIVGASYGGMVALAFGALAPARVNRLVVIGAAHESTPLSIALRMLQRRVVELGIRTGRAEEAVAIARGLAMTTYSTAEDFSCRFSSDDSDAQATRRSIAGFLAVSGENFALRCSPERFLAISQSLDLHSVRPEDVQVPTTLIAVAEDALVPICQVRELAIRLGARCALEELSSRHGHDTFLEAAELLAPAVRRALLPLTLEH